MLDLLHHDQAAAMFHVPYSKDKCCPTFRELVTFIVLSKPDKSVNVAPCLLSCPPPPLSALNSRGWICPCLETLI